MDGDTMAEPGGGSDMAGQRSMTASTGGRAEAVKATASGRWLLPLIMVIGAGLRLWMLGSQSLSNDEVEDLRVAIESETWGDAFAGARRFPPGYHLALRAWSLVVDSDLGARLFSVVIGLAVIAIMWQIGLALGSRQTAAATAAITAISPFAVWYSQETRVYGLYLALAAGFVWRLLVALDTDRRADWLWAAALATAGTYVHYYFGLIIVVAVAAVAISRRTSETGAGSARPRLLALAVTAIAVIPAVGLWLQDIRGDWGFARDARFGIPEFGFSYFSIFTGYTLGPSLRELHELGTLEAILRSIPWILAVGIPGYVLVAIGWTRLRPGDSKTVLTMMAAVPVLAVGLVSVVAPFGFNIRHTVWLFIPLITFAGRAIDDRRWWVRAAFGLVAVSSLIAIGNRNLNADHRNEDVARLAPHISQAAEDPVYVISGYMAEPVLHYLESGVMVIGLPDVAEDGAGLEAALSQIDTERPYWLVVSRAFHGDPRGLVVAALRPQLTETVSYAGVILYRGEP
jgi:hypothetical protein